MRYIVLGATSLFSLIATQTSAQGLTCEDVYVNATRNITVETRDRSAKSFYFSLYCERNGSVRSGRGNAELEFPIPDLPLSVSGDGAWNESELREFCSVGAQSQFYEASDISVGSFVVPDALASYNQCVALQRERLVITHQEAPPSSFVVYGEFTNNTVDAQILSVTYEPSELQCYSTDFSGDGSREVIDGSRKYNPAKRNFAITCNRVRQTHSNRDFYPRAEFQMSTSLGPYTVIVAEDTHLGFELASQAEAAFDTAIAERNKARSERNEARRIAAAAERKLESLEVRLVCLNQTKGPDIGHCEQRGRVNPNVDGREKCRVEHGDNINGAPLRAAIPRMLTRNGFNPASDIFAFACIYHR